MKVLKIAVKNQSCDPQNQDFRGLQNRQRPPHMQHLSIIYLVLER